MNQSYNCKIVTGQYQLSDEDGQRLIQRLFGEDSLYCYELYFHWYNLIHELGHAIMMFNNPARPHPAEEEQLVNDFAVAYWRHHGEADKLRELEAIVEHTLPKFPAPTRNGYLEYAKAHWGGDYFCSFEGYGWFQFSSVQSALSKDMSLEQALSNLCPSPLIPQEKRILLYAVNESMAQNVVTEAINILRRWGITLPRQIPVNYCDDVNCHMFCCEDHDQVRNKQYAFIGEWYGATN